MAAEFNAETLEVAFDFLVCNTDKQQHPSGSLSLRNYGFTNLADTHLSA